MGFPERSSSVTNHHFFSQRAIQSKSTVKAILIDQLQVLHRGSANPTTPSEQGPTKPAQAHLLRLPCRLHAG